LKIWRRPNRPRKPADPGANQGLPNGSRDGPLPDSDTKLCPVHALDAGSRRPVSRRGPSCGGSGCHRTRAWARRQAGPSPTPDWHRRDHALDRGTDRPGRRRIVAGDFGLRDLGWPQLERRHRSPPALSSAYNRPSSCGPAATSVVNCSGAGAGPNAERDTFADRQASERLVDF